MKKIEIIVERTGTGYSAYTTDMPVATTGDDLQKLNQIYLEQLIFI